MSIDQETTISHAPTTFAQPPKRLAIGTREIERVGPSEDELSQVVHDLKGPLGTISLEASLLETMFVKSDYAGVVAAASRIKRNVAFLDRLVHDLLDLAALDAGYLTLHRAPTELRALLEDVIDRVVSTRERGRVFLEARDAITTSVDDVRIQRVVGNLLHNALKYAPAATGVVVRLDRCPTLARVSVIDAGPGLDDVERDTLFDKYRRGTTAHGVEGQGLGLYVSRRIVEAHGGRIGVESVRGIGSRFFFELPC